MGLHPFSTELNGLHFGISVELGTIASRIILKYLVGELMKFRHQTRPSFPWISIIKYTTEILNTECYVRLENHYFISFLETIMIFFLD